MSTYLITRRDPCDTCKGTRVNPVFFTTESWLALESGASIIPIVTDGDVRLTCKVCNGTGYIDTQVDLLDVLGKLEWGEDMLGHEGVRRLRRFDHLRIKE